MRNTITRKTQSAGSGSVSFTSLTNWSRPTTKSGATRQVPFTTKTGLDTAISNMAAGDYIYYNGTGVLTISSGSTYPYSLTSRNPSSPVTIDFGTVSTTQINGWSPGASSGNYVKFDYSGTGAFNSFKLAACSNLYIYGGMFTSSGLGSGGLGIWALTHDLQWLDGYTTNVGGWGCSVQGNTTSGSASSVYNLTLRLEANRWSLRPSLDPHIDKGCGIHGAILHGNSGDIHDSTFAVYAHDSLQPGEVSVGQTWPEGGGASAIEAGHTQTGGGDYRNCTYYAKLENVLTTPNGTNPGSAVNGETAGNAIELFGNCDMSGSTIPWVECINTSGGPTHCASGSFNNLTPKISVTHGRHTNSNQYYNPSTSTNRNVPYDPLEGLVYGPDCI